MKNKLIETVRHILQKTVLPLRKKKNQFAAGFRLSITHRIAVNYLRLLIINGLLFFLIFPFLYLSAEKSRYIEMADEIKVNIQNKGETFGYEVNTYSKSGSNLMLYEEESNREVYNDVFYNINELGSVFKKYTSQYLESESTSDY